MSPSSQDSPPAVSEPRTFRAGTLVYTKKGLIILVVWLLWADLCFDIMEKLPGLIPLKLKALDAPNWLMAVMLSTIPMFLNATICPWVSFKSDRHRGPLGRRIPFILYTAPLLTVSLICVGFSEPISRALQGLLMGWDVGWTQRNIELVVVGVFSTSFAFFNMFVASVFWYLFNDVVPREVLSRFLATMRITSAGTAAVYNLFIFQFAEDYMPWIFLGGSLLYFVTFVCLCLKIKEPEYPPPPPYVHKGQGAVAGFKTYWKECFSHRFYWYYYLSTGFSVTAGVMGMFGIFFQQEMGLTLQQIGQVAFVGGILSVVLFYFAGSIADRFHPLRTNLLTMIINLTLFAPLGFLWIFFDPSPQFYFYWVIGVAVVQAPVLALAGVSSQPAEMRIFPQERYGQFCSANALVRSVLVMVAAPLAGAFIDVMKQFHGRSDFAYRFIPCWSFPFALLGLVFYYFLYREWKRLGGVESFVPPEVTEP